VAAMLWMGLYPWPILRRTEAAARHYVELVQPYVATAAQRAAQAGAVAEAAR
jgi:hypothetical protein